MQRKPWYTFVLSVGSVSRGQSNKTFPIRFDVIFDTEVNNTDISHCRFVDLPFNFPSFFNIFRYLKLKYTIITKKVCHTTDNCVLFCKFWEVVTLIWQLVELGVRWKVIEQKTWFSLTTSSHGILKCILGFHEICFELTSIGAGSNLA